MRGRITVFALLLFLLPVGVRTQETPAAGSAALNRCPDSVRQACLGEVAFIVGQIESSYVSGRRGLSEEEWKRRIPVVYDKLNRFLDGYEGYYIYVWRYFGLLMDDAHFKFPDDGLFSRYGAFTKNDVLFPLWVQTWTDGSVYNVRDYTGVIPEYAEIVSVNGRSAKEMALENRALAPGEEVYAMANMNAYYEPDPQLWPNFANFLFMEGIRPPFEVVYKARNGDEPDTVVLNGISRRDKVKLYESSGDKKKSKSERGMAGKPVVYTDMGDGTGVLAINSFWGKRWSAMLLFGKDWRYKRLLRKAMRRIDRDGIKTLVIDVGSNSGGMRENVYYTLDYFTDKPVQITQKYLITDNNRKLARTNVGRSPFIPEADRNYLTGYIDTVASGTLFRTDTVRPIRYVPGSPKHRYKGKVYVLTSHNTYSAGQIFAGYCRTLAVGPVAGQHCGGYNDVTGNAAKVTLPYLSWMEFNVPFSAEVICRDDDPYDYPTVDIPIERPFGEWLERENRSLERLLDTIRSGNMP